MKLRSLTVEGFRGFNERSEIEFHDRLTIIHAPNSYGKTSITEAIEWLIYGTTSRLDTADSKDEYKGAHRNCHLPAEAPITVSAQFSTVTGTTEFRTELNSVGNLAHFVDGIATAGWPTAFPLSSAPKPFVMQHALKALLIAKPAERFERFAQLLNLVVRHTSNDV